MVQPCSVAANTSVGQYAVGDLVQICSDVERMKVCNTNTVIAMVELQFYIVH